MHKYCLPILMLLPLGLAAWLRPMTAPPMQDLSAGCEEPAATTDVRFAVIGDYGLQGQAEADVAARVKTWMPALVLTVGDNNYPAGEAATIDDNIGQYYQEFMCPYGPPLGAYGSGSTVNQFFPALGNHDWYAAATPSNQPYLDYFSLPGNERYYDFIRGPVHFYMLDSGAHEPDGISAPSAQAAWLQAALSASTSPWDIVLLHHAPYSSGIAHGSAVTLQWPYREWGAEGVIAGHDHSYERLEIDGFPYFVDGLGGSSRRGFGTPLPGSKVRYSADYGAMLVDATGLDILFKFVTRTGQVIDTYSISTHRIAPADFDDNNATDVSVFRAGVWYVRGQGPTGWGEAGDILIPADFDGDSRADLAVYRPSTGGWRVKDQFTVAYGGAVGDVPVPGDYDGDGDSDPAIFRPSTAGWYVKDQFVVGYGLPGDIPVPGDYNGDGTADIAVFRDGVWYIRGQGASGWGQAGDIPVPGDYDGNGTTDLAIYRPSTGGWRVKNQFNAAYGGLADDVPVPGDYDGNGTTDAAIYRSSTAGWYVKSQFTVGYGLPGDWPIPAPDTNGDGDPYQ